METIPRTFQRQSLVFLESLLVPQADFVETRLQGANAAVYSSIVKCVKKIIQNEGPRALFQSEILIFQAPSSPNETSTEPPAANPIKTTVKAIIAREAMRKFSEIVDKHKRTR
ncbi:hypothetical protein B9Z55_015588 [Caenorhabditis nigoni]|uniref:Uncharacterized protein n=1 Tax=Caenorhabditis nigoni TaxID=1611254 RepID=A0A2G5UAY3_9PELO|nr:hypothetical protein B9Z55_015588 [Caenorhabditis nigoni]